MAPRSTPETNSIMVPTPFDSNLKQIDICKENTTKRKSVSFSDVVVREYPMTLGDNPSVSRGPPISISWEHIAEHSVDLESHIKMTPFPRRQKGQMIMPPKVRRELLYEMGYSHLDIVKATEEARCIRAQRLATSRTLKLATIEELKEKMGRKFKKIFLRTKAQSDTARLNPVAKPHMVVMNAKGA